MYRPTLGWREYKQQQQQQSAAYKYTAEEEEKKNTQRVPNTQQYIVYGDRINTQ